MWAISKDWAWVSLFSPDEQEGPFDLEGPSTFVIPSLMYRTPSPNLRGPLRTLIITRESSLLKFNQTTDYCDLMCRRWENHQQEQEGYHHCSPLLLPQCSSMLYISRHFTLAHSDSPIRQIPPVSTAVYTT